MKQKSNAADARMTNSYVSATWIKGQINRQRSLNQRLHPSLAVTSYYGHTVHKDTMVNWQGPDPNVNIYGSGKDPPHPVGRHGVGASKRSSDHLGQVNTVAKRTHTGIGNIDKDMHNNILNINSGPLYRYQHGYVRSQPYTNVTKPCNGVASVTRANIEGYKATPGVTGPGPAHVMQSVRSESIPENPRHVWPHGEQESMHLKDYLPDLTAEIMMLIPHMDNILPTIFEEPYYRDTVQLVVCVECNYTIFADAPACKDLRLHNERYCHTTHKFSIIKLGSPKFICTTCRDVAQKSTSFFVVESMVHHQRQHNPYIENPKNEGVSVDIPSLTNVHAPQHPELNLSPTNMRRLPPSVLKAPGMNKNLDKANGSNKENSKIVRMQPTRDRLTSTDQRAVYNSTQSSDHIQTRTPHIFQNGGSKQIESSTKLNHDGVKTTPQSSKINIYSDDVELPNLELDKTQHVEKGQLTTSSESRTQTNSSCSTRKALGLIKRPHSTQQRPGSQTSSANSTQTTNHSYVFTQSIQSTIVQSDSQENKNKHNMPNKLGPKCTNMLSKTTKRYPPEVPGFRSDIQGRRMSNGSKSSIAAWADPVIDPEKIITIQPETPPQMTEQRDRHINPLDNRDVCTNPADSHRELTNQKPETREDGNRNWPAIGGTGVGDECQMCQTLQQQQCSGEEVGSNHQNKHTSTIRQNATLCINRHPHISSSIPSAQRIIDSRAQQLVSDTPMTPPTDVQDNRYDQAKRARQARAKTLQQAGIFVSASHEDNTLDTHLKDDLARDDSTGITAQQQDFTGVQILQQSDMSFKSRDVVDRSAENHESTQAGIQQQNIPQEVILQNDGAHNMSTVIEKRCHDNPGETGDMLVAGSRIALRHIQPDATPACRNTTSQSTQESTHMLSSYDNNSDSSSESLAAMGNAMQSKLGVEATMKNYQLSFEVNDYSLISNNLVIDLRADNESDLEQDSHTVFLEQNWPDRVSTARTSERASPTLTIGHEEGLQDDLENSKTIYRSNADDVTIEESLFNSSSMIEESPTKYGRQLETSAKLSRKHEVLISELSALTNSKYQRMVSAPTNSLPRHETSADTADDEDECMIIEAP